MKHSENLKNLRPEGIRACGPDKDQWGINRNTVQKPVALDHLTPLSLSISEVSLGKQELFHITVSVRKEPTEDTENIFGDKSNISLPDLELTMWTKLLPSCVGPLAAS